VRLAGVVAATAGSAPDAAARAEVQHHLAGAQLGDGGGVAAAEAGQHRGLGQGGTVGGGVELGGDAGLVLVHAGAAVGAAAAVDRLAAATGGAGGGQLGEPGVAGADLLAQGHLLDQAVKEGLVAAAGLLGGGAHGVPPWRSATAARRPRASGLRE
jgi:hypothetical protein